MHKTHQRNNVNEYTSIAVWQGQTAREEFELHSQLQGSRSSTVLFLFGESIPKQLMGGRCGRTDKSEEVGMGKQLRLVL